MTREELLAHVAELLRQANIPHLLAAGCGTNDTLVSISGSKAELALCLTHLQATVFVRAFAEDSLLENRYGQAN